MNLWFKWMIFFFMKIQVDDFLFAKLYDGLLDYDKKIYWKFNFRAS